MVTSVIGLIEVGRVVRRRPEAAALAPGLAALRTNVPVLALTPAIVRESEAAGPPALRTLDAIHLASALSLGRRLDAFVSYDRLLLRAVADAGITVAAPGADHLLA
jgi:predicted nucleic acid-binding protein